MDERHLLATVAQRVLERITNHALRSHARDQRDRLGGGLRIVADADVVLEARVEALGVLADQDDVDVVVATAGNDVAPRPHVGVEVEGLAERDVDRAIPFADRRLERTLEREVRALDRLERLVRHRRALLGDAGRAGDLSIPVEVGAGGVEDRERCFGDVGTDSVTGNQSAGNCHGCANAEPPGQ